VSHPPMSLPELSVSTDTRPGGDMGTLFEPWMVPVMRQRIAMMSVLGFLAAGLGCQHIGGKCDCQAHPGDAVIHGPTTPYPTAPAPAPGASMMPTPIPPANNGKGLPTDMLPGTLPK